MDPLLLTYYVAPSWNAAGAVVPSTITATGLTREQWVRSRHVAAVAELQRRGLDHATAWWVAAALVSHWARETGWGRAEHRCSEGNIRATSAWHGDVMYLQGSDDAAPAPYRAYPVEPNCETGVADAIRLALDGARYRPAYQRLLASASDGPYAVGTGATQYAVPMDLTGWYSDLTAAGWSPHTAEAVNEYRSIAGTVARIVGAPPFIASPWGKAVLGAGVTALLGTIAYAAWGR